MGVGVMNREEFILVANEIAKHGPQFLPVSQQMLEIADDPVKRVKWQEILDRYMRRINSANN